MGGVGGDAGPRRLRRISQEVGHCGPTSVSMLLDFNDVTVPPHEIAAAAGLKAVIHDEGSRLDDLARAVDHLAPSFRLLMKCDATLHELGAITSNRGRPVGVEWQGKFVRDGIEFDAGHYSVVTGVDADGGLVHLVDPDDHGYFLKHPLTVDEFLRRWWEDNDWPTGEPGRTRKGRTFRVAFLVVPADETEEFSAEGFRVPTLDWLQDFIQEVP